jgi:type I restriction enzyme, S subunit
MKSSYKPIGELVRLIDERNRSNNPFPVMGINITKNFMPSIANTTDSDLSKYKVIRKGQFAYSPMQVGRDEVIRVVLYTESNPAIISPAYLVFEILDTKVISPEYLMMWFQRSESDRFGWFISDGSVRSSLEWERFCEIVVPLHSNKERQEQAATIYSTLQASERRYFKSVKDLQMICDSFMTGLVEKYESKTLGDYIEQSTETNYGLGLDKVRGVSISKALIKPKANMTDVDLTDYKLLKKGEFVFNPNTARMGEKIPIALNTIEDYLVSKIYPVFRIKTDKELMPEFLLLWFKRPDFDRYARFHSWGSARETFNWEDICEVHLPIPPRDVQESVVAVHAVLQTRSSISVKVQKMISPSAPILFSGIIREIKNSTK